MMTALLIVHGLFAVALIGSVSHQAIAATSKYSGIRARPSLARLRAGDPNIYSSAVVILFLIVAIMGAILYPQYRLTVRPFVQSMDLRAANGAFELKEHFSALGMLMLPAYWAVWRQPRDKENQTARLCLTWLMAGFVWWNFIAGQLLVAIKGLFA